MKAGLIIAGVAVAALITVKVLGSTLAPPKYEKVDLGITGPLAMDQVSKALHARRVWKEPRTSHSVKDRRELLVGELRPDDVFQVTNHARKGATVWIHVVGRSRPEIEGWVPSPADDPFRAEKVK